MTLSDPSLPPVSAKVTEVFLSAMGQARPPDVEELCAKAPEHAAEIRRRYEAYRIARLAVGSVEPAVEPAWREFLDHLAQRGNTSARYRADGSLGRGGMGVVEKVYDEDLRRHLALKRLRRQDASDVLVGRFLEEAQVAAQLDHPGIAPVHELGVDGDGQPYFTMKLVEGEHLGRVMERVRRGEAGWTVERVVGTVLRVCEAMAYAHAKGVIHRDIKPENVMVGRFGETYVMDWGLARVVGRLGRPDAGPVDEEATTVVGTVRQDFAPHESPLLTMAGEALGTPYYMAPEQAQGRLEALGPATDVYAIGCILYQLIAGVCPYQTRDRSTSGEVIAALLAGPPPPLRSFAARVAPELEAICEKAMARDPTARYVTMAELAGDLRSFQENRVVKAYATGPIAELRKWVSRNQAVALLVAAGALIVVGMIAVFVVTLQSERNVAEENARRAERNERRASESADVAREINEFLTRDLLAAVAPSIEEGRGRNVTMREVLDEAARRIGGRFEGRPRVEANIRSAIGETYRMLGEYDQAAPHLERARELIDAEGGELEERLTIRNALGLLDFDRGRYAEAARTFESILEASRREQGETDPDTLTFASNLAGAYRWLGRFRESRELDLKVFEARLKDPGRPASETLGTFQGLALSRFHMGEYEEAERLLAEALERSRALLGDVPDTLNFMANLATLHVQLGRFERAEELFAAALAGMDETLGEDHPLRLTCLRNLAGLYRVTERLDEAIDAYRSALAGLRARLGDEHESSLACLRDLAVVLCDQGRYDEAAPLLDEAIDGLRASVGPEHNSTLAAMSSRAVLAFQQGRPADAEPLLVEILEIRRRTLGDDHRSTLVSIENLVGLYIMTDRPALALPLAEELVARTPEEFPGRPIRLKLLERARRDVGVEESR